MDKKIIFIIVLIIVAGVCFWAWQSGFFNKKPIEPIKIPNGIVLFFGEDCPHCKIVEEFLTDNKIENITKLEIPFNGKTSLQLKANVDVLLKITEICKVDVNSGVAIPFLYNGKDKCFTGDIDVINFLKNEANIK